MRSCLYRELYSPLAALTLVLAAAGVGRAEQTTAGAKPPGASDTTKAAPPAGAKETATPATRPDETERKRVINSPEWRAMQHGLNEWLSIQQVYTPSQLRKVKAGLNAKVARMNPQELVAFMVDMDAKLKILMSKEAEQCRLWIEQRLANQVNLTPEQLKKMRPDVLDMTSAEMQVWLDTWQEKRQMLVSNQKAFEKGRQERIKFIDEQEKDDAKERDEALNRSYYEMSNGSPYGGGGVLNNPTWFRGGGGYYGGGAFGGAWGGYGW